MDTVIGRIASHVQCLLFHKNRKPFRRYYEPSVGFHYLALDRVLDFQSETDELVQSRAIRRLLWRPSRSVRTEEYIYPIIN